MNTPAEPEHEEKVRELETLMHGDPFDARLMEIEAYERSLRRMTSSISNTRDVAKKKVVDELNRIRDSKLEDIKDDIIDKSAVYNAIEERDAAESEDEKHSTKIQTVISMRQKREERKNRAHQEFGYGKGVMPGVKNMNRRKGIERLLKAEITELQETLAKLRESGAASAQVTEIESAVTAKQALVADMEEAKGGTRKRSRRKNKKSKIHHKKSHHKKSKTHRKKQHKKTHRKY